MADVLPVSRYAVRLLRSVTYPWKTETVYGRCGSIAVIQSAIDYSFASTHQKNTYVALTGIQKNKKPQPKMKKSIIVRSCKYYLDHNGVRECLGTAVVPKGKDMDDAFPSFHREHYSQEHQEFLASQIIDGAVLRAESDWNDDKLFLAYILKDDLGIWIGRQSTLEYFGVIFTPVS